MFKNIEELIEDSKNYSSVIELMIAIEMEQTGRNREQIWEMMEHNLETMLDSVKKGLAGKKSLTGLTGGDAKLMDDYIKSGKALSGELILGAARDAVAVNEVNAQMGLICATPTAGSAGCLPGVLTSAIKTLDLSHEQQVEFLFVAGAFGLAIANNATISGAEGGCQDRWSCFCFGNGISCTRFSCWWFCRTSRLCDCYCLAKHVRLNL